MLSTPFICCSMGVATACSRVCASAPTYVARTWISGGVMLGNCATGKVKMVSVPTSTKMMEITIATMGRFMKNFDIALFVLGVRAEGLGVHLRTGSHFLNSFGDDSFPAIQPVRNNPSRADAVADSYRSNADFVVAIHHRNLIAALEL